MLQKRAFGRFIWPQGHAFNVNVVWDTFGAFALLDPTGLATGAFPLLSGKTMFAGSSAGGVMGFRLFFGLLRCRNADAHSSTTSTTKRSATPTVKAMDWKEVVGALLLTLLLPGTGVAWA